MKTQNQTFAYTTYVSKIGIKTIYWGTLFSITDIKSKAVIKKSHNAINMVALIPVNINSNDKGI